MLDAITLGAVTARGTAKRTRQGERMNTILLHVTKSRSRRDYAQTELAVKR